MEKIAELRGRILSLEKEGTDTSRVGEILTNLEKTIGPETEDSKLSEAISKFEMIINKMESDTGKVRRVARRSGPAEKGQAAPSSPETGSEKEMEPEGGKAPEVEPSPEKRDEIEPEAQVEEGNTEGKPPADEGSGAPVEEQESDHFDRKEAERSVEEIDRMAEKIRELKGDVTPIKPHVDAMKRAFSDSDGAVFKAYFGTVRNWMVQYLVSLRKARVDPLVEEIRKLFGEMGSSDGTGSLKDLSDRFEALVKDYEKADHARLEEILPGLAEILERSRKKITDMTDNLTHIINDEIVEAEMIINEVQEDMDVSDLKEDLQDVKEKLFNGNYTQARSMSSELLRNVRTERVSRELRKLESMLLSVEPLLDRIQEVDGADSSTVSELMSTKDSIIELSKTDVKEALRSMGELLDRATMQVAEIEESLGRKLMDRIKSEKKEAESLKDVIDTLPIIKILEKAGQHVMDGNLDNASLLLDKADMAFNKLKERRSKEVASARLEETRIHMEEMLAKGVDISPLNSPVLNAEKALSSEDMEGFEKQMRFIEERMGYLRNEELRIDYQKALINVMNGLNDLKDGGEETEDLMREVDDLKGLYTRRKYEQACGSAQVLLEKIARRKLEKVIDERKKQVEQTLAEAEGLLVDVSSPGETIENAGKMMEKGDVESALDLLCHAQVELEDLMTQRTFSMVETEILSLEKQCMQYSLDPGDVKGVISSAYALAEEEKYRKAMEVLTSFRESLTRKVSQKRVHAVMEDLGKMIRDGRALGIQVSPFKASLTKARVLLDAGDVSSALDLVEGQISELQVLVKERRVIRGRLDKLRGNLLAQQGKISRLERSGITVEEFKERVNRVKSMIDNADPDEAEAELLRMDQDINKLLTRSPEQLKREMMNTIMDGKETRPLSIDLMKNNEKSESTVSVPRQQLPMDQERARSELFTLIPKIKVEITRMHSKGLETDEYRKDIEKIQNLVKERKYLEAFSLGRDCYARMTK